MRTICYYPELVQITGSINTALMMAQLEFWFRVMEGKPFYKFLEPCGHELYKVGDSWSEELGMTTSEVRSAFKKIGTMYKSKRAFLEAMESQDVFKGKPYAAYYDRMRKTTYYLRNDDKVEDMMPRDLSPECYGNSTTGKSSKGDGSAQRETTKRDSPDQGEMAKRDGSVQKKISNGETSIRQDTNLAKDEIDNCILFVSVNQESKSGLYREDYRKNNIENSIQESQYDHQVQNEEAPMSQYQTQLTIPFEEIVSLYNDNLGESLGYIRQLTWADKNKIKSLWHKHSIQLNAFKKAFAKVAASKFLCGKVEGKKWRASFKWLLTENHLLKVLEGFYDDFKTVVTTFSNYTGLEKIKHFNQIDSHHFDFEEIERLERLYIDHKLESQLGGYRFSV